MEQLIAIVDNFEFRINRNSDKNLDLLEKDFEKFFRMVVIDDKEIVFLDEEFANIFMRLLNESFEEGIVAPIVLNFVAMKFNNYFENEGMTPDA